MNRTRATLAALTAAATLATSVAVLAANPGGGTDRAHLAPLLRPYGRMEVRPGATDSDPSAFAEDPPAPEATPAPKPDEWKDAPLVHLDHDVDACKAYRVREWVKIHCSAMPFAGASLLAGTRAGVAIWIDPPKDDDTMKTLRGAEVIFPVRRGDGRLFQIGQFGEGYDGPVAWNAAITLSEQWVEGERAPIVSLR